jgi:hypothetical protein
MRLGTIRAREVCFNSTAGVNWLKKQDSQFRQPGSCRARTASSPVRYAQYVFQFISALRFSVVSFRILIRLRDSDNGGR